jgi:glycosyltransferase involved in cell wall biosynthesis
MKILVAQQFCYPRGGDWTYVQKVMDLYERKGHDVVLFGMRHPENGKFPYDEYFVSHVDYAELNKNRTVANAIRVLGKSIYSLEAKDNIRRLIEHTRPDIAHLNNIHKHITPSIVSVLNEFRIPILWTMHSYSLLCPNDSFTSHGEICEACKPHRFYQCTIKRCTKDSVAASLVASLGSYVHYYLKTARRVDMIIAPSSFLREKFIEFGYDSRRIVHLPNFVNLEDFEPSYNDEGYILFYGRISVEKGLKTLLRAMEKIPAGIMLKVAGRGPGLEEAVTFCRDNRITVVEFLGFQTGEALTRTIAGAKFIVIPSECYEILPYTMLESFSMGKPIIASETGEFSRIVAQHDMGTLFKLRDHMDLAEKISWLWNADGEAERMGRNARHYAERYLTAEYHYQRLADIIAGVSASYGKRHSPPAESTAGTTAS